MTWKLPEPMLISPVPDPGLRPGWAAEPKWDGFRALVSVDAGKVVLRSRRGTEMAPAVPEVVAGAVQLPDATALDGELVVWDAAGRLAFERLQDRLQRRGAGAARAAAEWPAHFVAFDLLRLSGTDTTLCPYRRRRAALESLFTARRLSAPWALCPSTTAPDTVHEWLTWAAVGMEGVVYKRLDSRYEPSVRGWRKYKVLEMTEAIVGAVTGALSHRAVCCSADTTTVGAFNTPAGPPPSPRRPAAHSPASSPRTRPGHPWTGWSFAAGWGTRETLDVTSCSRAGGGGQRRRRPRRRRPVAPPRTPAPPPHRPLPHRRPPPDTAAAMTAVRRDDGGPARQRRTTPAGAYSVG